MIDCGTIQTVVIQIHLNDEELMNDEWIVMNELRFESFVNMFDGRDVSVLWWRYWECERELNGRR